MKTSDKTRKVELSLDPKLAEAISWVLNHPELPDPIYEGIQTAIQEIYNSELAQMEVDAAPQYIDLIIRGYHKKKSSEPALENVLAMRSAG